MTRTRSRNEKDKNDVGAGSGAQPHWTLSSGGGGVVPGAVVQEHQRVVNGPQPSKLGTCSEKMV